MTAHSQNRANLEQSGFKGQLISYIHFVPNLPFFMQEFIFSKNKKGVDHFP